MRMKFTLSMHQFITFYTIFVAAFTVSPQVKYKISAVA